MKVLEWSDWGHCESPVMLSDNETNEVTNMARDSRVDLAGEHVLQKTTPSLQFDQNPGDHNDRDLEVARDFFSFGHPIWSASNPPNTHYSAKEP